MAQRGRPSLTKTQQVDLFNLRAKQYAKKYGVTVGTAYTLKHLYKQKYRRMGVERQRNHEGVEEAPAIEAVRELLEEFANHGVEIPAELADNVHAMRIWQMGSRDEDGNPTVTTLRGVEIRPEDPDFQTDIIREVPPVIIKPSKIARKRSKGDKVAAIVPDLQGGYRNVNGELTPIHDESVVSVGLQIIRDAQPDLILLNGDNLDLAEIGTYTPDSNHFTATLQATLDRVHEILSTMRANAPDAEIVWLAGNHENRLNKQILKHNLPLWGLKRPNSDDDYSWLSVGHLMNLDDIGVTYISGYPANRYLINDRLQVVHGDRVRSNGSTAPVYAKEEELSTIYGHVHRREAFARTNRAGRMIMGLSYGTWADTQGSVPSYGNGVNDEGYVIPRQENWTNGMGIVEFRPGDAPFQEHFIHIDHTEDYQTRWDGKVYKPNVERDT